MNGIPNLDALRSISLYGLSSITMNFEFGTDPYFARQQAFERVPNATVPDGVAPGLSPLFSPSGLIYRYVLQSPDRSAQDLKILNDWVVSRKYRSIQGVADLSGLGGTTMQYQVQLDPKKLFAYGVSVKQITDQLAANNERRRRILFAGGQFYYVTGNGYVKDLRRTSATSSCRLHAGIPVYIKDLAIARHRSRAPPRPVRLHAPGRCGGGHRAMRERAGAGQLRKRRGDDGGAESSRCRRWTWIVSGTTTDTALSKRSSTVERNLASRHAIVRDPARSCSAFERR
jgi:multidrug efflux pump subunit AcrB